MIPFLHQMQVKVRENGRESVRVDELKRLIVVSRRAQLVAEGQRLAFQKQCEETFGSNSLHGQIRPSLAAGNNPSLKSFRQEGANSQAGRRA